MSIFNINLFILSDLESETTETWTLDDIFLRFMDYHINVHTSQKHQKSCQRYYDIFFAPHLGKYLINKITTNQIEKIINEIYKRNGTYTANHALILIRHIFNKAIKWGYIYKNPANAIQKFKTYPRERFLIPNEIKRLLSVLNNEKNLYFKTFFSVLLLTGQRCGNVKAMKWNQIDFDSKIWQIPITKNGTSMRVPLVNQLIYLLKNLKIQTGYTEWVFPMKNNIKRHLSEPKHFWKKICQKADISNLRIHDLRRTLASYECMNGVNLAVVSKTLNHRSLKSTEVYARVDTSTIEQALQMIANKFYEYTKQ